MITNLFLNRPGRRNILRLTLLILLAGICSNTAFATDPYTFTGGGTGENAENAYVIKTAADLNAVRDYPSAYFKLADDLTGGVLDLTSYLTTNGGTEGWVPIGTSDAPFTGHFDGNGKKITGLWIDRTTNGVGLFGTIGTGATIEKLGVVIAEGKSVKGGQTVGGLVGRNVKSGEGESGGAITNCSVTGKVEGTDYIGGLVCTNDATITNCFFTGEVEGTSYIGGLVCYNTGTISGCYATGKVTASGDGYSFVGGLVAFSKDAGTIIDSYATSEVSGAESVGGLVGNISSSATIRNCYATGNVTGTSDVGGLVGYNSGGGTVTNSYFNTDAYATSVGGTGKNTTDMKKINTFEGWNFTDTWKILEDQTYPYLPVCQSNPAVIKKAVESGVTLSLTKDADSVLIYAGSVLKQKLTNVTAGERTYTATYLNSDVLKVVVYEANRAPSYPVSATVPTTIVRFTVATEDNAPTSAAVVTFNDVTNDAGDFVFKSIPNGSHTYKVTLTGYQDATGTVTVSNADKDTTITLLHPPVITAIYPTTTEKVSVATVKSLGDSLNLTFNRTVKAVAGGVVKIAVSGVDYTYTLTGEPGEGIVSDLSAKIKFLAFKNGATPPAPLNIVPDRTYAVTVELGAFASVSPVSTSGGTSISPLAFTTKKVPTLDDVNVEIRSTDVKVTPKASVTGLGTPTVKYNGSATFPTAAGTYTLSLALGDGDNYSATATDLPLETTVTIKKVTFNVKDGDGPAINNATVTFNEDTVRTGSSGNYQFTYISSYKPSTSTTDPVNLDFLAGYTASLDGYQAVDSAKTFTASAKAAIASGTVNVTLYHIPRIKAITPKDTVVTVAVTTDTVYLTLTFDRTVSPSLVADKKLSITKRTNGEISGGDTYIYNVPAMPTPPPTSPPPSGGIVFSGNSWSGFNGWSGTSAKIPFKAFKNGGAELAITTGYTYTLLADSGAFTNGALSAKSDTLKFTTVKDTLTVARLGLKDTIRSYSYVAAIDTAFKRKAALPADPVIQYSTGGATPSAGFPTNPGTYAVSAYVEGNANYKPATFKLDTIVIHKVTFKVVEDNADKTAIDGAKVFFKGDSVETGADGNAAGEAVFTYIASHFVKGYDITATDMLDKTYTYKVTKTDYLTVPPPAGVVSDTKLTDAVNITLLKTNAPPKIIDISPKKGDAATVTYGNSLILYFDRRVTAVVGGEISITTGATKYIYSIPTNASIVSVDNGVCTAKILFTAFRTTGGTELPAFKPDNTEYAVAVEQGAFKSNYDGGSITNDKYTSNFKAVKANITKPENEGADEGTVRYTFTKDQITYARKKLIPIPEIKYSGVSLNFKTDYDTIPTGATGANTNAGTVGFIKIKAKEGSDYTGELTLSFTILKAVPSVTFPTVSVPYNYHDFTLSNVDIAVYGTGGTGPEYGTFTWKTPSNKLPSKAGMASYAAVFTPKDTANYDYRLSGWIEKTGTIERTISVTLEPADGEKEEGEEDEETSAGYKLTLASMEDGLSLSPDTSLWTPVAKGGSFCFDVTGVPTKRGLRVTITGVGTVDGVNMGEGRYNICINGIGADIKVSIVTTTPSDAFDVAGQEVRIYPNPVKDAFTVDNGHGPISKVVVNDLSGRRVAEATPSGETVVRMNASSWASGVYIITIESEGSVRRMKVVKR